MKPPPFGQYTLILSSLFVSIASCQPWPCQLRETGENHFPKCDSTIKKEDCECKETEKILLLDKISYKNIELTAKFSGMHMEIGTSTEFKISDRTSAEKVATNCILLHVQDVPSSFFVDQYEVKRLENPDMLVHFNQNIDVEKPQYQASNASILVYTKIYHSEDFGILTAKSTLPWHSRYHRPSTPRDENQTHTHAQIEAPSIWSSCISHGKRGGPVQGDNSCVTEKSIVAPCVARNSEGLTKTGGICTWEPLLHSNEHVTVAIPIGQYSHSKIVLWTTVAVTLLSTVILCIVAILHKHEEISPKKGKSIHKMQ